MNQQLQREGEGAYVVTFLLRSLIKTTSWERGGVLTTNEICVIGLKVLHHTCYYIRGGGVFTSLSILTCVPTLRKLSLILNSQNTPSNTTSGRQIFGSDWYGLGSCVCFAPFDFMLKDSLFLTPPQARLVSGRKIEVRHKLLQLVSS